MLEGDEGGGKICAVKEKLRRLAKENKTVNRRTICEAIATKTKLFRLANRRRRAENLWKLIMNTLYVALHNTYAHTRTLVQYILYTRMTDLAAYI